MNKGQFEGSEYKVNREVPGGTLNTGGRGGLNFFRKDWRKASLAGSIVNYKPMLVGKETKRSSERRDNSP